MGWFLVWVRLDGWVWDGLIGRDSNVCCLYEICQNRFSVENRSELCARLQLSMEIGKYY